MEHPFFGKKMQSVKDIRPVIEHHRFTSGPIEGWVSRFAPAYSQEAVALAAFGLLVACLYLLMQICRVVGH